MAIKKRISEELNVSKTTVSRVLNNCGGVEYATKEKILELAVKYGYKRYLTADVGIVMPKNPKYFWNGLYRNTVRSFRDAGYNVSAFVYSSLNYEEDALVCLSNALESNISVLIAALPDTPRVREIIEKHSGKMLIILLEEFFDAVNTFYVGNDDEKTGYGLTSAYMDAYPERRRFAAILTTEHQNMKIRCKGFERAVREKGGTFRYVRISEYDKLLHAHAARELYKIKDEIDCVFCPDGIMNEIGHAIYKLNVGDKIHTIGLEENSESRKYIDLGVIKGIAAQDLDGQIEKCVEVVNEYMTNFSYPDKKRHCIKSNDIIFD